MPMLTVTARVLRPAARGESRLVRRRFLREATRSERRVPIDVTEWGDERDDAAMAVSHPDDVPCAGCAAPHPSHRVLWVKRRTIGPCDCCLHWEWEAFGPCCTSLPLA